MQENIEDLSLETLIKDTEEVLVEVLIKYPQPTIIIVGHRYYYSMNNFIH